MGKHIDTEEIPLLSCEKGYSYKIKGEKPSILFALYNHTDNEFSAFMAGKRAEEIFEIYNRINAEYLLHWEYSNDDDGYLFSGEKIIGLHLTDKEQKDIFEKITDQRFTYSDYIIQQVFGAINPNVPQIYANLNQINEGILITNQAITDKVSRLLLEYHTKTKQPLLCYLTKHMKNTIPALFKLAEQKGLEYIALDMNPKDQVQ